MAISIFCYFERIFMCTGIISREGFIPACDQACMPPRDRMAYATRLQSIAAAATDYLGCMTGSRTTCYHLHTNDCGERPVQREARIRPVSASLKAG